MMVIEQAMTHVASFLKRPIEEIRHLNLYQNGEKTHFDMPLENKNKCINFYQQIITHELAEAGVIPSHHNIDSSDDMVSDYFPCTLHT